MSEAVLYRGLADAILVLHFLLAGFVVAGFALILIGMWAGWSWIHNRIFRLTHLAVIGIIVMQAWLGRLCPLTVWENELREKAGQTGYAATFMQHWLQKILFYQAEPWVFAVVYTVFGSAVLICLVMAKPGGKS